MNHDMATVRRGTAPDRTRTAPARYEPRELLVDTRTGAIGEYRGDLAFGEKIPHRVWLRPVGGGLEWDVPPEHVRPATDDDRKQAAR